MGPCHRKNWKSFRSYCRKLQNYFLVSVLKSWSSNGRKCLNASENWTRIYIFLNNCCWFCQYKIDFKIDVFGTRQFIFLKCFMKLIPSIFLSQTLIIGPEEVLHKGLRDRRYGPGDGRNSEMGGIYCRWLQFKWFHLLFMVTCKYYLFNRK